MAQDEERRAHAQPGNPTPDYQPPPRQDFNAAQPPPISFRPQALAPQGLATPGLPAGAGGILVSPTPLSDASGFSTGGVQLGNVDTQHMDPTFRERLLTMVAASGGRLKLASGFRTNAEQQALWDRSDKSGRMVARPGSSNHEKGIAADLGGDIAWAHAHAAEFGLYFPMSWEPWHIEPVGSRSGSTAATAAGWTGPTASTRGYTNARSGYSLNPDPLAGATDPTAGDPRTSLDYQINSLMSLVGSPDFWLSGPAQLPADFTSMPNGTA